jgi:hypothetical protein
MSHEFDQLRAGLQPELQSTTRSDAPFGAVGAETAADCQQDRDATTGRWVVGNRGALVAGADSTRFWAQAEAAQREIEAGLLQDAGHGADDAPRALRLAVAGIAQAALVRDSAYQRLVESGGPLTSRGRGRRAFVIWLQASERLHRGLQLVGLERRTKPVTSLTAAILAEPELGGGDE